MAKKVQELGASLILIGGSTIADQAHLDEVVMRIHHDITLPILLFPGNVTGISQHADAILFSSLLNSTNTYFIIGAQAIGSIQVMKAKLEAIPMGYLVFGDQSTTGFVGQVRGIPLDKPSIAVMYAMAAHYLGMRTLYLEAGSGSEQDHLPRGHSRRPGVLPRPSHRGGWGHKPRSCPRPSPRRARTSSSIGNLLEKEGFEAKLAAIVKAIK